MEIRVKNARMTERGHERMISGSVNASLHWMDKKAETENNCTGSIVWFKERHIYDKVL